MASVPKGWVPMKTTAVSTRTLLWGALVALVSATAPHPLAAETTLIRCGTLIDGVSDAGREDVAIRIEDDRIAAVGPFDDVKRDGGAIVDLSDSTCLPGLIDAHAHLLIATDDFQVDHLRRSSAYKALRGLSVAQQMLRSGWTSVRVLGDADVHYAHLDVRTAIEEGMFVGPCPIDECTRSGRSLGVDDQFFPLLHRGLRFFAYLLERRAGPRFKSACHA